jgi:glycosyltransferase involved in cell wall biosynthesis
MRVLQLGPYPPPHGGVSRNMTAIRAELLASGHQCSIIATSRSTLTETEPDVYHPGSAFQLLKLLATLEYDVLHLHIGGGIPSRVLAMMFFCAVFSRGRSVLTLHSGGYPLSEQGLKASKNSLSGFVFRRFSRVIGVNTAMAEMFGRYGVEKQRIRVILPFSHELPDKTIEIPPAIGDFASRHKPLLLSTSLLEKEYDVELQIDALGEVLKEFPQAGLLIAGGGSLEKELKEKINKTGYSENILMAGDLDHKIALNLIDGFDMLLRTTHFDGDAISVREALFLETPVIATDNGMRPKGAELIPVGDEAALAEAIKKIARNERKTKGNREEDSSNLRAVVELYEEISRR